MIENPGKSLLLAGPASFSLQLQLQLLDTCRTAFRLFRLGEQLPLRSFVQVQTYSRALSTSVNRFAGHNNCKPCEWV